MSAALAGALLMQIAYPVGPVFEASAVPAFSRCSVTFVSTGDTYGCERLPDQRRGGAHAIVIRVKRGAARIVDLSLIAGSSSVGNAEATYTITGVELLQPDGRIEQAPPSAGMCGIMATAAQAQGQAPFRCRVNGFGLNIEAWY